MTVGASSRSDFQYQDVQESVAYLGSRNAIVYDFPMLRAGQRAAPVVPFPWDRVSRIVLKLRDLTAHDEWRRETLRVQEANARLLLANPGATVATLPTEPDFVTYVDTTTTTSGVFEYDPTAPGQISVRYGLIDTPATPPVGTYDVRMLAYQPERPTEPYEMLHERNASLRSIIHITAQ